jgi:hypothetical protein
MFTNGTKNFCIGVLVFLTGAFAQAETNLDYQKALFRQTLKSMKTTEDAFFAIALGEKTTDGMMIIARDLKENKVPAEMPKFDVKNNKILVDGKDSEVSIKAYSPITLEFKNRTWSYNTKQPLDENYTALKKFFTGPRKSASLISLFISEARADRLRPTLPGNPNGKDVLMDVAKFYMALGVGAAAAADAAFLGEMSAGMTRTELAKDAVQGALAYVAAPAAPLYMQAKYNSQEYDGEKSVVCEDGKLKINNYRVYLNGEVATLDGINVKKLEKYSNAIFGQAATTLEIVKNSKGENEYYVLDQKNNRVATYTYADYDTKLLADRAAKHCFDGNMKNANVYEKIKTAIANAHAASFAHLGGPSKDSSSGSAVKKGTN